MDRQKKCSKCLEIKDIDDFYVSKASGDGRASCCRLCDKKKAHERYSLKRDEILNQKREYHIKNAEARIKYNREYRAKNPDSIKARKKLAYIRDRDSIIQQKREYFFKNKDSIYEYHKEYRRKNRTRLSDWRKEWIEKNPKYRVAINISSAIRSAISSGKNGRSWEALVGYDLSGLTKHLEKLFTSEMTWDNYGIYWEIDHIIPIAAFNFVVPEDIDFKRCWALKNLRPLQLSANRSKRDKLSGFFQPSLNIAMAAGGA